MFDTSQTDGQPLPDIGSVNGDPREYLERLARFIAEQAIALDYSDEIASRLEALSHIDKDALL